MGSASRIEYAVNRFGGDGVTGLLMGTASSITEVVGAVR